MLFWIIIGIILPGISILLIPRLLTWMYAWPRTFTLTSIPPRPVAIVFGAGLWRDGSPSPVLMDRINTAAELYFSGKVQKLLMSGDNRFINYNEPGAMRQYALSLGIPDEDIVLDYAGRRTYDTCYRARKIFGVRKAILVTQSFHLPRSLYTCNHLGISAIGVAADRSVYALSSLFYWHSREIPATLVALWEVHFTRPLPVLGDPEPIFPDSAH